MVEVQSRASLVNASALCSIEQEVKEGNTANVIAEISAELQREREKNADLMEKISALEAQIQERDHKGFLSTQRQGSSVNATERRHKRFKRQKLEVVQNDVQNLEDCLVNWMSMDETQFSQIEKLKGDDSAADCNDTDDTDEEDECVEIDNKTDHNNGKMDLVHVGSIELKENLHEDSAGEAIKLSCFESSIGGQSEQTFQHLNQARNEDRKNDDCLPPDKQPVHQCADARNHDKREIKNKESRKTETDDCPRGAGAVVCAWGLPAQRPRFETLSRPASVVRIWDSRGFTRSPELTKCAFRGGVSSKSKKKETDDFVPKETCHTRPGSGSLPRKPPKIAFCPKEVKRILESEVLLLRNAQSHTIRKIIVFASLGTRHGCDDIYELDFNHFSVLRKGEPYVSPKDPGEYVLYENPGIQRKIFYPNRQNPTLCPVQILEEEKAMRRSDPSCPSCFFLCIKYGGRTRNLPQNEYVRQRMGRNKLKSFGPLMCRMAMLVHVRSGSFFFKALGITLLFMAGFPDDVVQRETKYRSLDLLQKYYRSDEDAEGEELFLPQEKTGDIASLGSKKLTVKTTSTKSKGKKQSNSSSKPPNLPGSSIPESAPSTSAPPTPFGHMGYSLMQAHAMAAFQSIPYQTPPETPSVPGQVINSPNVSYHNQTPYHMFPQHAANSFMPMIYWSAPNAFPSSPYASAYGYRPFPSTANYISIHNQPYHSHPSLCSLIPKVPEKNEKNEVALKESDTGSDSSSSSTETKDALLS